MLITGIGAFNGCDIYIYIYIYFQSVLLPVFAETECDLQCEA